MLKEMMLLMRTGDVYEAEIKELMAANIAMKKEIETRKNGRASKISDPFLLESCIVVLPFFRM